jgi:hypothetical protein
MGGGDMAFYRSSGPTVLPHLGFSFGGADGDDGRLKLTPVGAPQGEAKDDGSIDLTDLLCGADSDNGRLKLTPGGGP